MVSVAERSPTSRVKVPNASVNVVDRNNKAHSHSTKEPEMPLNFKKRKSR